MRYLLILLVCLAGCGMPETARSAKQAEQAVDGMLAIYAETDFTSQDEAKKAKAKVALETIGKLLQSAKISLQPVLTYLGEGKEIKTDTTINEAIKQPDTFSVKAHMQAGRAAIETENRLAWENYLNLDINSLEGWIGGLSMLLTGSGAAGIAVVGVIKKIQQYKKALGDSVAFGKDIQAVDPKDEQAIEAVKSKHAKKQKARGTKDLIDSSLQKVKDGTHA